MNKMFSRFCPWKISPLKPVYLTAAVMLMAGCSGAQAASPADPIAAEGRSFPVVVVATTPLLADLARNVGGELVEVYSMVPPGVDAHSYQTTPRDSVTISSANLTISNGAGLDDGLASVLNNARPSGAVHVVASVGLDARPGEGLEGDPHFWQDPLLAIRYVEQIRRGLSQADPFNAEVYRQKAQGYSQRLQRLDQEIAASLDRVPPGRKVLITHHQAFSHLAKRYGWRAQSLAAGDAGSVTPEAIIQASRLVNDAGLPSVFVEPRFRSPALDQLARDAGAAVSPIFAGLGGDADTYVNMMRFNARSLADNLR